MRKTCIFMILMCVLGGSVFALDVVKTADVSCRTDILYPTTNRSDHSKLSVRSDSSANKSYIKFDLSELTDPNNIRGVQLRVTLFESELAGTWTCDLSAVNDECLDNIGWAEGDITWGNAPANDTDDWYNPDFTKATLMGTYTMVDPVEGEQFFVDVTPAILGDTDGIVQFILHNSSTLLQFCTHDQNGTMLGGTLIAPEDAHPALIITYPPLGADYPNPENGEVVKTDLPQLSWINPDPNDGSSVYCDVYLGFDLGSDPNRPQMDKVTLGIGVESVVINETNFPHFYDEINSKLYDNSDYYWLVDSHVTGTGETIEGETWRFSTYDNEAPYNVSAGSDQWIALDSATAVSLSGSADDDGLPADPGALSYTWERTAGPDTAVIDTPNASATTVSFTERGDYEFTLTVSDGDLAVSDIVRVVVGDDDCDASHILSGDPYNDADYNEDCIVDLQDFVDLIASDWLNCTDDLTNCAE